MPDDKLYIDTSDRGLNYHLPVPSKYGGGVSVSTSSAASGPHVWLRATVPVNLNEPTGPTHEAPMHLAGADAWLLVRQLAALVVNHYQGDARPSAALDDARAAVAELTGWGPAAAETLLRRLAHAGFVLVDIGGPAENQPDDRPPVAGLTSEPEDGALVAYLLDNGDVECVYIRDDKAAVDGEYDPDEHWFTVGDDDAYPSSWAELTRAEPGRLIQLYRDQHLPSGVTVRREWGVHSTDGTVYSVSDGSQDTVVREATLLYRGVPDDPERAGEPGCAPASRYVMDTPRGQVATGWSWPASWAPPPDTPAH